MLALTFKALSGLESKIPYSQGRQKVEFDLPVDSRTGSCWIAESPRLRRHNITSHDLKFPGVQILSHASKSVYLSERKSEKEKWAGKTKLATPETCMAVPFLGSYPIR